MPLLNHSPQDAFFERLLSEYETKKLSTEKIINSDYFKSLPIADQTRLLQTYSSRMQAGQRRFDSNDRSKTLGAMAGLMGAGMGGIMAYNAIKGNFTPTIYNNLTGKARTLYKEVAPHLSEEGIEQLVRKKFPFEGSTDMKTGWDYLRKYNKGDTKSLIAETASSIGIGGVFGIGAAAGATKAISSLPFRDEKEERKLLSDISKNPTWSGTAVQNYFLKKNLPK